jgi:hypothetical protein
MNASRALTAFLAAHRAAAFDWSVANCCHFAAAWVRYATGQDPMAGLPVTPSARAAWRLVQALGGTLQAAWSQRLGRSALPAAMAQVGDLVLMPTRPHAEVGVGGIVGVCVGASVVLLSEKGHLLYAPLYAGIAAWRLSEAAA